MQNEKISACYMGKIISGAPRASSWSYAKADKKTGHHGPGSWFWMTSQAFDLKNKD